MKLQASTVHILVGAAQFSTVVATVGLPLPTPSIGWTVGARLVLEFAVIVD
jgi:hypothetical protein